MELPKTIPHSVRTGADGGLYHSGVPLPKDVLMYQFSCHSLLPSARAASARLRLRMQLLLAAVAQPAAAENGKHAIELFQQTSARLTHVPVADDVYAREPMRRIGAILTANIDCAPPGIENYSRSREFVSQRNRGLADRKSY